MSTISLGNGENLLEAIRDHKEGDEPWERSDFVEFVNQNIDGLDADTANDFADKVYNFSIAEDGLTDTELLGIFSSVEKSYAADDTLEVNDIFAYTNGSDVQGVDFNEEQRDIGSLTQVIERSYSTDDGNVEASHADAFLKQYMGMQDEEAITYITGRVGDSMTVDEFVALLNEVASQSTIENDNPNIIQRGDLRTGAHALMNQENPSVQGVDADEASRDATSLTDVVTDDYSTNGNVSTEQSEAFLREYMSMQDEEAITYITGRVGDSMTVDEFIGLLQEVASHSTIEDDNDAIQRGDLRTGAHVLMAQENPDVQGVGADEAGRDADSLTEVIDENFATNGTVSSDQSEAFLREYMSMQDEEAISYITGRVGDSMTVDEFVDLLQEIAARSTIEDDNDAIQRGDLRTGAHALIADANPNVQGVGPDEAGRDATSLTDIVTDNYSTNGNVSSAQSEEFLREYMSMKDEGAISYIVGRVEDGMSVEEFIGLLQEIAARSTINDDNDAIQRGDLRTGAYALMIDDEEAAADA